MNLKRLVRIPLIALSLSIFVPITLQIIQAHAETVTVPNQDDCPGGNEGWRRGLEVNATTKVTVTHCTRIENVPVPTPTPCLLYTSDAADE